MPHVLGRLRLWTMRNGQLVEIATLDDTSNHAAGSPHLRLSAIADIDGDGLPDLIIPTLDRRSLRAISFKNAVPKELETADRSQRQHMQASPALREATPPCPRNACRRQHDRRPFLTVAFARPPRNAQSVATRRMYR